VALVDLGACFAGLHDRSRLGFIVLGFVADVVLVAASIWCWRAYFRGMAVYVQTQSQERPVA
jgi:hypothetical protein